MSIDYDDKSPFPNVSRAQVARDMFVFQAKLFTDGLKDILLSPLSLIAGLAGIFLARSNPGIPLYELLRFGRKVEVWIDLFAAAYPNSSQHQKLAGEESNKSNEVTATSQDFDALVDRLQSSLFDPETRAQLSDRSKAQLDAIAKKLRGG